MLLVEWVHVHHYIHQDISDSHTLIPPQDSLEKVKDMTVRNHKQLKWGGGGYHAEDTDIIILYVNIK